jgi:hypothetical protein
MNVSSALLVAFMLYDIQRDAEYILTTLPAQFTNVTMVHKDDYSGKGLGL